MSKPILIEARYRNDLERKVADQLERDGIKFSYESNWVPYSVPQRPAKYLPDFPIANTPIILEVKGRFGGFRSDSNGAAERKKLILIKEQHPELDVRLVFQNATKKIYKGSKTTYADWAKAHGFMWSDKGVVPPEWISEMKHAQR